MVRLATLVAPVRLLVTQQAVMFDVIGLSQLESAPKGNQQHDWQHLDTQPGNQPTIEHSTDQRRLQNLVFQTPYRLAAAIQPLSFKIPGTKEGAGHLAKHKTVNTLAHAS